MLVSVGCPSLHCLSRLYPSTIFPCTSGSGQKLHSSRSKILLATDTTMSLMDGCNQKIMQKGSEMTEDQEKSLLFIVLDMIRLSEEISETQEELSMKLGSTSLELISMMKQILVETK